MTSQRLFSNGAALLVWAPKFSPPAQAQIWPDNSREVYDDQTEYGKAKNWPHMEDNSLSQNVTFRNKTGLKGRTNKGKASQEQLIRSLKAEVRRRSLKSFTPASGT